MTLRYCSFDLGDSGPIDIHRNWCIIIFSSDICPKSKVVPVCCWSKSPSNIQSHRVEIQSTAFGCESETSLNSKLWFGISPIISWFHYISLELMSWFSEFHQSTYKFSKHSPHFRHCGSRFSRQNLFTWAKGWVSFDHQKRVVHTNQWKMVVGLPGRSKIGDFLDFCVGFTWYFFLVSQSVLLE